MARVCIAHLSGRSHVLRLNKRTFLVPNMRSPQNYTWAIRHVTQLYDNFIYFLDFFSNVQDL